MSNHKQTVVQVKNVALSADSTLAYVYVDPSFVCCKLYTMDHLPLPRNPIVGRLRVPLICSGYDNGTFLGFPMRCGWPKAGPGLQQRPFWYDEQQQPSDTRTLQSFLQAWIFFGLLHHVLAPVGIYNESDYVDSSVEEDGNAIEGNNSFVHTRKLEEHLEAWVVLMTQRRTPEERLRTCAELADCLKHVRQNIVPVLDLNCHAGFDVTIRQSLGAILEAVWEAAGKVDDSPSLNWNFCATSLEIHHQNITLMLQHGWCISEVARLKQIVCSSFKVYVQNLRKPSSGYDHSRCTVDECSSLRMNTTTYRPQHVDESCTCSSISPDMHEIDKCLAADSYPVLRFTGDDADTLQLETVRVSPETPYVAISHVWADGMGNPWGNELPRCQILRMQKRIRALQGRTFVWNRGTTEKIETRELYLWCDTLCCPTNDVERRSALRKMKEVYEKAAYVLVLDLSLECISFSEIDLAEAAVRIITSRWNTRLWTFQEAGLADKLLIQFNDSAVDYRDFIWSSRKAYQDRTINWRFWQSLYFQCSNLRCWFWPDMQEAVPLQVGVEALRYRGVSVPSDEVLCIAAAFSLDYKTVNRDRRMETVWKLLAESRVGISQIIVFNLSVRLTSPGFRWAPMTMLERISTNPDIMFETGKTALLSSSGLHVSFPAWQVRLVPPFFGVPQEFMLRTPAEQRCICNLAHPNGGWYNVYQRTKSPDRQDTDVRALLHDTSRKWFIIHNGPSNPTLQGQKGLLASLSTDVTADSVLRTEAVLWVARLSSRQEALYQSAMPYTPVIRRMLCVRLCVMLRIVQCGMYRILRRTRWLSAFQKACRFWQVILISILREKVRKTVMAFPRHEIPSVGEDNTGEEILQARYAMGASLSQILSGATAEVTEVFEEKAWCID